MSQHGVHSPIIFRKDDPKPIAVIRECKEVDALIMANAPETARKLAEVEQQLKHEARKRLELASKLTIALEELEAIRSRLVAYGGTASRLELDLLKGIAEDAIKACEATQ